MDSQLFNDFVSGTDTLRVYEDNSLVFTSDKDRLLPLMEYIDSASPSHPKVVIMDKVMGNAAALLSIRANCGAVYSPLGSKLATDTLDAYGIEYHFTEIVPHMVRADGKDMCPMEKLSIDKSPDEFYEALKTLTR